MRMPVFDCWELLGKLKEISGPHRGCQAILLVSFAAQIAAFRRIVQHLSRAVRDKSCTVAGTGLEPGPSGYEPSC